MLYEGLITMKRTTDLMNELNQTSHIDQYLKDNEEYIIDLTLSNYLCDIFEKKSLSKSDVIKKSDINEIYGYQILSGKRTPSRNKLISLCIGAKFTLDETNEILKVGGFSPLFPKIKRDSVIIFGIQNHYSIWQINESLYTHQLQTL